jgi:hypothetical protein
MKAGYELDAVVAEKVMGWKKVGYSAGGGGFATPDNKRWVFKIPRYGVTQDIPEFSTRIAAAWTVVEKLQEMGFNFAIASIRPNPWVASISEENLKWGSSEAETVPMAICLAALEAVDES